MDPRLVAAQADYVDASKNLMIERGKELEAHIRDTMGQRYLDKHPVFTPETNSSHRRVSTAKTPSRRSEWPAIVGAF